jgi:hypothetical protein
MALTDKDLLENANKYRLHQDVLRWTLLGGYAVFFTATANILANESFANKHELYGPTCITLFIIGNCYMFVLAVENWFYNLFARHVADCEAKIMAGKMPLTVADFARQHAKSINPFHPSFFFALLVTVLGNTVYLYFGVSELFQYPLVNIQLPINVQK